MDLSQPSVAARKEFWEERAKSREPSHPCRNCQVAQDIEEQLTWLPLVFNKFLQVSMTSWIKQLQGIDHSPHSQQMEWVEARSCGEHANNSWLWCKQRNQTIVYSKPEHIFVKWLVENQVRDFMDMTKNEEAYLASRPNSPPLKKGPFVPSRALVVNIACSTNLVTKLLPGSLSIT